MQVTYALTELQLAIMKLLWERPGQGVQEMHEALLRERRIAQSTVATLLSRMEKRGLVARRAEGRQHLFRATVDEAQVRRSVVAEFTSLAGRLFEGDVATMVSHLLTARDVDPEDLERIRAVIAAREAELKGGAE
jgi:predicted transcriptional regulator